MEQTAEQAWQDFKELHKHFKAAKALAKKCCAAIEWNELSNIFDDSVEGTSLQTLYLELVDKFGEDPSLEKSITNEYDYRQSTFWQLHGIIKPDEWKCRRRCSLH